MDNLCMYATGPVMELPKPMLMLCLDVHVGEEFRRDLKEAD